MSLETKQYSEHWIKEYILDWEYQNGESFNDYFTHDVINHPMWIGFISGLGFTNQANAMIKEGLNWKNIIGSFSIIDQQIMFDIYEEYKNEEFNNEAYEQNVALVAKFIYMLDYYYEKFLIFLKENPIDENT